MIYAMVYEENGDVVGTYATREEAERKLEAFVASHPEIQDEIGLRPYEGGVPGGPYEGALDVLGGRIARRHLV